jgi:hypothetical protein
MIDYPRRRAHQDEVVLKTEGEETILTGEKHSLGYFLSIRFSERYAKDLEI